MLSRETTNTFGLWFDRSDVKPILSSWYMDVPFIFHFNMTGFECLLWNSLQIGPSKISFDYTMYIFMLSFIFVSVWCFLNGSDHVCCEPDQQTLSLIVIKLTHWNKQSMGRHIVSIEQIILIPVLLFYCLYISELLLWLLDKPPWSWSYGSWIYNYSWLSLSRIRWDHGKHSSQP